jgi:hypothetical protein
MHMPHIDPAGLLFEAATNRAMGDRMGVTRTILYLSSCLYKSFIDDTADSISARTRKSP